MDGADAYDERYASLISNYYLPEMEAADGRMVALAQSIISSEVAADRECVGISGDHCFCSVLEPVAVDDALIERNRHRIDLVVETVNNVTGDGQWHCARLRTEDFTMTSFLRQVSATSPAGTKFIACSAFLEVGLEFGFEQRFRWK